VIAPRDHSLAVGSLSFHYVTWGPEAAPLVDLLHGLTGHARTWDAVARVLFADFRVIALDQRGHGDSYRAPDGRLVEITGAGHTAPADQPEDFARAGRRFLEA
jgi:pimeloyl-ACP methyl ester carboxylesterase